MMLGVYSGVQGNLMGVFHGNLETVRNDEVCEVLNGKYELSFQYPITGVLFSELKVDRFVTARPNAIANVQPFSIYRITRPINGWVTVYAWHVSRRLNKCVCLPFSRSTAAGAVKALETEDVAGSIFHFSTDLDKDGTVSTALPVSTAKLMGSEEGCILSVFGGEWEFDGFDVRLLAQRGQDRGVQIAYGLNLTDYLSDTQRQNRVNGIYAYYLDEEGAFAEGVFVKAAYYMGMEGLFVEARDYTDQMGRLDLVLQQLTPTEKLQRLAEDDLTSPDWYIDDGLRTSFRVSFVQLSKTEEYKNLTFRDDIALGDTVHVAHDIHQEFAALRVTEIRYQPSRGRYNSIGLGLPARSIVDTIRKK